MLPRWPHSWLGFAAGGGVRFPATPGWGLLAAVVRGVWCVMCGVWCAAVVCWRGCGWCVVWLVPRHSWRRFLCATPRHSWLGFAAGGGGRSSPLLAEGPGCGSPPLLAGVRWRRCVAWSVPCHSWRRFLRANPRHSWLGLGAVGGVWSPASPGWGPLAAVVCGMWCPVCGVWCVVCGVWRVACGGGVCGGFVAGVWCGWSLATPGGGSCVLLPATPGWVSLLVVVWGSPPLLAGARRLWWCVSRAASSFVVCVCGVCGCARWPCCVVCCVFVVSVFLVVWCGGGGCFFRVPFSLALVCVCALCGPSCWCGWRGGGGGVVRGVAVVRARVCARGVWLVGWGVSYLCWFSSSVVGMFQKAEEEVL